MHNSVAGHSCSKPTETFGLCLAQCLDVDSVSMVSKCQATLLVHDDVC